MTRFKRVRKVEVLIDADAFGAATEAFAAVFDFPVHADRALSEIIALLGSPEGADKGEEVVQRLLDLHALSEQTCAAELELKPIAQNVTVYECALKEAGSLQ